MKTYIGIDNGVSGGIVAIMQDGGLVTKFETPIKRGKNANEVDIYGVKRCFEIIYRAIELIGHDRKLVVVVLEEPGGSKSAKAATSMAGSFHAFRGMFETLGIRWERITPARWQKQMLPGCKTGETKPRALARVSELWPGESWMASPRCKKASEGMVDAALIAEYGRRMCL